MATPSTPPLAVAGKRRPSVDPPYLQGFGAASSDRFRRIPDLCLCSSKRPVWSNSAKRMTLNMFEIVVRPQRGLPDSVTRPATTRNSRPIAEATIKALWRGGL